jgi:hypothetical protein
MANQLQIRANHQRLIGSEPFDGGAKLRFIGLGFSLRAHNRPTAHPLKQHAAPSTQDCAFIALEQ